MDAFFISKLKPLMDAIASRMVLYVPGKVADHYVFNVYDPEQTEAVEFNEIRACTPVKEFLFPPREVVSTYPKPTEPPEIKPFAILGLKDCDIKSMAILDKVFTDEEFEDPQYVSRRRNMFVISSDCTRAGESCFCSVFEGKPYCVSGFDLNVSGVKDGFVVEPGSKKGHAFIQKNSHIFADVPHALLDERDKQRKTVETKVREKNARFSDHADIRDAVKQSEKAEVYDQQAEVCIECQACTRVCPTCHCFFLYDDVESDYFKKMKIWDSCMRFTYAAVAGGENPNKLLGDRMRHRLLHKFVHFVERYGINMCVGCGRCVDADAGGMDLREILKQLTADVNTRNNGKTSK